MKRICRKLICLMMMVLCLGTSSVVYAGTVHYRYEGIEQWKGDSIYFDVTFTPSDNNLYFLTSFQYEIDIKDKDTDELVAYSNMQERLGGYVDEGYSKTYRIRYQNEDLKGHSNAVVTIKITGVDYKQASWDMW